jgi:hypothetical protein
MNDCCDRLKRCYLAIDIGQFERLRHYIEHIACSLNRCDNFYRCKTCGQIWEQHIEPFARFDYRCVIKSFLDKQGNPRPIEFVYTKNEIIFLDSNQRMIFGKVESESHFYYLDQESFAD